MKKIKRRLIKRDGMNSEEADSIIQEAINDLTERLLHPQDYDNFNICEDHFGFASGCLDELLNMIYNPTKEN